MMRISTRTRYGLRALAAVARDSADGPVSVRRIAHEQGLPTKYLERLFAVLKATGLVVAVRGARGGYTLARPADQIPLIEVFRVLEGPLDPVECLQPSAACPREDQCATRDVWQEVADAVNAVLAGHTVADLLPAPQCSNPSR